MSRRRVRMEDVNDHRNLSSESHRPGSISERLTNQRISFLNDNGLLFPLCIAAAIPLTTPAGIPSITQPGTFAI
jgi:hypothetical protein